MTTQISKVKVRTYIIRNVLNHKTMEIKANRLAIYGVVYINTDEPRILRTCDIENLTIKEINTELIHRNEDKEIIFDLTSIKD